MEKNEIRIGNQIKQEAFFIAERADFPRGNYTVKREDYEEKDIVVSKENIRFVLKNIEYHSGILLSEEYLLKFGFEKIGINFQIKGIAIWYSSYAKSYQLRYYFVGSDIERTINIEYVHQLQNLFFTLTGEELTIKN